MRRAKSISEVCGISRVRELRRPLRHGLTRVSWLAVLAASAFVALPAAAGASLPDGRVYELISPANKNGNYVASGATTVVEGWGYSAAAADGNALVFLGSGAMGDASSSMLQPYVARRSPGSGWSTGSATPTQPGVVNVAGGPLDLVPSFDFSRFAFGAGSTYSPEQPLGPSGSVNLYLSEDPFVEPVWLGRPAVADAIPKPGENPEVHNYPIVGGSPSLSTVYFTYSGTLVAKDESRAPSVGNGLGRSEDAPWGFYEWSGGVLSAAGVLPDGTLSPFGAVSAAMAGDDSSQRQSGSESWQSEDFNGEVSSDGSRAFFVSPDPIASTVTDQGGCEKEGGPCTSAAPELYVRESALDGTKSTVLVSRSQLPGHVGEPAPDGAVSVPDAGITSNRGSLDSTDVFASPDGSQAFFASSDRLTEAAPEDTAVKEYDFDLQTGALTYLPGVVGPIVASSRDGTDFVFKNTATTSQELDLWSAGPDGGSVRTITQLPEPANLGQPLEGNLNVEARASADGSVFAFDTNAPMPGAFNNQAGYGEVYRYDVPSSALACVSCPPAGVTASGNADISYDNGGGSNDKPKSTVDSRVMSADGSRVFFDTPDPLVSQDSNGRRDVYEWEDGSVFLISSGASPEDSFYLDNSESGGDVFFNTVAGLVAADADGAYDAYDARVPHPGDNPPPSAVPCEGDVCQGPPSVPSLLGTPASATFNGAGNVVAGEAAKPVKKKAVKKKIKHKRSKRKKGKRASRSRAHTRMSNKRRGG